MNKIINALYNRKGVNLEIRFIESVNFAERNNICLILKIASSTKNQIKGLKEMRNYQLNF